MLNVYTRARQKSLASKKLRARALFSGFDLDTMRPPFACFIGETSTRIDVRGTSIRKEPVIRADLT